MKTYEEIDAIMQTIPDERSRQRWCGGENGACACIGCVKIWNRVIMWETITGRKFSADPEYIDEQRIQNEYPEVYNKYKVAKEEWELWRKMNGNR